MLWCVMTAEHTNLAAAQAILEAYREADGSWGWQSRLAKAAGITPSFVSKIVSGDANPSSKVIAQLQAALDAPTLSVGLSVAAELALLKQLGLVGPEAWARIRAWTDAYYGAK